MIGLALSGGGARAIAFHLGCLRALQDRGVLQKVSVISAVSGGSVIAAMYAYQNDAFDKFDGRVTRMLARGLRGPMLGCLLSPELLAKIVATNLVARPVAATARLFGCKPPIRRWASRTDALEAALEVLLGKHQLAHVARPGLDVVLNACELRTGTAFRFSNTLSGSWRLGQVEGNPISVAHAVACSAAYPQLLPAMDREYTFVRKGSSQRRRVVLCDGGAYDNLGISCLEPGRDKQFSLIIYPVEYIICCYAGRGQFSGENIPFGFASRAEAAFESIFRKVQDAALHRLHLYKQTRQLRGFVLPYLGQMDQALPFPVANLVPREEVYTYPTNFSPMSSHDLERIALRGEQLTGALLSYYIPEL
jgi:NTE family protein